MKRKRELDGSIFVNMNIKLENKNIFIIILYIKNSNL